MSATGLYWLCLSSGKMTGSGAGAVSGALAVDRVGSWVGHWP